MNYILVSYVYCYFFLWEGVVFFFYFWPAHPDRTHKKKSNNTATGWGKNMPTTAMMHRGQPPGEVSILGSARSRPLPADVVSLAFVTRPGEDDTPRLEVVLGSGEKVVWAREEEVEKKGQSPFPAPSPPVEAAPSVVHSPCGLMLAAVHGPLVHVLPSGLENAGGEGAVLRGHTGSVLCCTFSPCGRFLVTGSADSTLRVWSASSGRALHTWRGENQIRSVAFSPCGRMLACGGASRSVSVFPWGKCQSGPGFVDFPEVLSHTPEDYIHREDGP